MISSRLASGKMSYRKKCTPCGHKQPSYLRKIGELQPLSEKYTPKNFIMKSGVKSNLNNKSPR